MKITKNIFFIGLTLLTLLGYLLPANSSAFTTQRIDLAKPQFAFLAHSPQISASTTFHEMTLESLEIVEDDDNETNVEAAFKVLSLSFSTALSSISNWPSSLCYAATNSRLSGRAALCFLQIFRL